MYLYNIYFRYYGRIILLLTKSQVVLREAIKFSFSNGWRGFFFVVFISLVKLQLCDYTFNARSHFNEIIIIGTLWYGEHCTIGGRLAINNCTSEKKMIRYYVAGLDLITPRLPTYIYIYVKRELQCKCVMRGL